MTKTVLLTGVSGYIGLHCAQQLLNAGYTVRGSVRNDAKAVEVRETLEAASVDSTNLSIVELDLTSDAGWDAAAKGCDYIMHVASPFAIANPKSEDEMIVPAVQGTLRALRAAQANGVKRVVLTSSIVAMAGHMKTGTFDQNSWTDVDAPKLNIYSKSKTLAERAAWDFVETAGAGAPELVVINPGGVFGPPLGRDLTGQTMTMVAQMLRGKMPMVPDTAFTMVDVRDVAELHVKALTNADAVGQRFIAASAKAYSVSSVAKMLIDEGYKGPSARVAPNFVIKLMALFDAEARGMVGVLGSNVSADNSKTLKVFDWTPISVKQSALESAAAVTALQS